MGTINKNAAVKLVRIKLDWCKGCGICVAFCPKGALTLNSLGKALLDEANCSLCGICEAFCPDFAIEFLKEENGR